MSVSTALRVSNRQRLRPLRSRAFKHVLAHLLDRPLAVPRYTLGIHIVRAAPMSRLNAQFLAHEGPTDVITFDHGPDDLEPPPFGSAESRAAAGLASRSLHGEIYICIDVALAQAREFGTTWQDEVMRYAIHGLLHLLGHDDRQPRLRARMKRREEALVRIARSHPEGREFGALAQPSAARGAAVRITPGPTQPPRRAPAPRPGRRH